MNQKAESYLKSIELLSAQISQSYHEAQVVRLPKTYRQVNKIVVCGMGGSQLGIDIVRHLFSQEIKLPLTQVRGYYLPKFVDSKALVFLLSYSGNTEEVLSMAKEAVSQKAKCVAVSVGGQLEKFAKKHRIPAYIFEPINNPSGQPRLGTGYIIGLLLNILKRLNLINIKDNQIATLYKFQALPRLRSGQASSKLQTNNNYQIFKLPNLNFTKKLLNKIPVIVASEFLQGNAHVMANQINESAKQLALYFPIPELNHHLLEGLTFPKENKKLLHFLFFYSKDYHPRNKKRYQITQEVLKKQKIPFSQIEFKGNKISQAMQMLMFGSYFSYKLSKLNKVEPNKIPWVNLFKKRLKD